MSDHNGQRETGVDPIVWTYAAPRPCVECGRDLECEKRFNGFEQVVRVAGGEHTCPFCGEGDPIRKPLTVEELR